MEQLRTDMSASPPLTGSYSPRKGDMCAAKFTDGEWYRARVEKIEAGKISVLYVDFGNVSEGLFDVSVSLVLGFSLQMFKALRDSYYILLYTYCKVC